MKRKKDKMENIISFFYSAYEYVIDAGYEREIDHTLIYHYYQCNNRR